MGAMARRGYSTLQLRVVRVSPPVTDNVTFCDYLALQGCNGALEGFTNQPAILVGKRIEGVNRLLRGLAVELDISPCAMPAWLALFSRRRCRICCKFVRRIRIG